MIGPALTGFATGFSLILAIGAQNAFVLKQGLMRQHVFAICLVCAVSDAILIAAGVSGFAAISARLPWLEPAMRIGGAAFLIWYGARSFAAAFRRHALKATGEGGLSLRAALATTLALTWLNPHVYLDTVALLGAVSSPYPGAEKAAFAGGAMLASFVFFFSLGYGARLLAPLFARPAAWRVLDFLIAAVMWTIAAGLLFA